MITRTNESRILIEHISYKCKCKFDVIQIGFGMMINVNARAKTQEENMCRKGYIWNTAKRACQNGKCFGSIIKNSVICGKSIEITKGIPTKTAPSESISTIFKEKKVICEIKNLYVLLAFLLITVTLLVAVLIYCFISSKT